MILLSGVTHDIRIGATVERVISSVTTRIPTDRRIALLGSSPSADAALFEMLSGVILPSAGTVKRYARVSFPVGFSGGFSPELTVRQNVEYVAKLYDQPPDKMVDFIATWLRLGSELDRPFVKLPRPTMREFAWAIAFGLPFDVYLLTANRKVTVSTVWRVFYELFKVRAATCGFIASADPYFARLHCDMGMVLRNQRLELFEDMEEAIRIADEAAGSEKNNSREYVKESRPMKPVGESL